MKKEDKKKIVAQAKEIANKKKPSKKDPSSSSDLDESDRDSDSSYDAKPQLIGKISRAASNTTVN
jgi:hypothetical protein